MKLAADVLLVADEAWIATALLHYEYPEREDFSVQEILERARREKLTGELRPGVGLHVSYHCVANKPPNPGKYRMLFETSKGRRRLYREGDETHPKRTGKTIPDPSEIPQQYRYLLDWYHTMYAPLKEQRWLNGLFELEGAGTGIYGDPDEYVRKLREGWE